METTKRVTSLAEEFKAFALKGNVVDLAVGVIIGAAFGKIVDSMVKDIFMPLISLVAPGPEGYAGWAYKINGAAINYGKFLAEVVNFVIVALVLFIVVKKFLGWAMRTKKAEPAGPPPLTTDQALLSEIRDLLKTRQA